jgi:hypothetical protein
VLKGCEIEFNGELVLKLEENGAIDPELETCEDEVE